MKAIRTLLFLTERLVRISLIKLSMIFEILFFEKICGFVVFYYMNLDLCHYYPNL